jgi:hypothetical protein
MTPDEFMFKLQNLPPETVLTAKHLAALLEVLKPAALNPTAQIEEGNFDTYPSSKIINEAEVGDWIGEAVSTLQKWRVTGKGPKFIKKPKNIGYRVGDVRTWLDSLTVASTAESHVRLNRLGVTYSTPMPYFLPIGDGNPLPFFQSLNMEDEVIDDVVFELVEHYDLPQQNLPAWFYNQLRDTSFHGLLHDLEGFLETGADVNQVANRLFGQEHVQFTIADVMAEHDGADTSYGDTLLMLIEHGMDTTNIENASGAFNRVVNSRSLYNKINAIVDTMPIPAVSKNDGKI